MGRRFAACVDRKCVPPTGDGSLWGCSGDKHPCPAPALLAPRVPQEVVSAGGPAAGSVQAPPGTGRLRKPLSPWVCDPPRAGPCAAVSFAGRLAGGRRGGAGSVSGSPPPPFSGCGGGTALGRQRQRVSGRLVPAEQLHQPELPAPVPRGAAHQAAAPGLHHPHPAVDLRAVLQGAWPPGAAGPGARLGVCGGVRARRARGAPSPARG